MLKCPCCDNKINLFQKWKKFHFWNEPSSCKSCNKQWQINKKYKALIRLCFLCYGLLLILPYIFFSNEIFNILSSDTQNIVFVIYNLIIFLLPALLIDLVLLIVIPLECND